jgi:predicted nucleotidyltransferase
MDRSDVTPYVTAWRERRRQEREQLVERLEAGRKAAHRCAQFLARQYGVNRVYLFGSMVGNTLIHQRSDIDLAVEGLSSEDYLHALTELWMLLPPGFELDLVPLEDAFAEMIERIQREGEVLYDAQEIRRPHSRHSA